jgi:hypothetical protein
VTGDEGPKARDAPARLFDQDDNAADAGAPEPGVAPAAPRRRKRSDQARIDGARRGAATGRAEPRPTPGGQAPAAPPGQTSAPPPGQTAPPPPEWAPAPPVAEPSGPAPQPAPAPAPPAPTGPVASRPSPTTMMPIASASASPVPLSPQYFPAGGAPRPIQADRPPVGVRGGPPRPVAPGPDLTVPLVRPVPGPRRERRESTKRPTFRGLRRLSDPIGLGRRLLSIIELVLVTAVLGALLAAVIAVVIGAIVVALQKALGG